MCFGDEEYQVQGHKRIRDNSTPEETMRMIAIGSHCYST